MRNIISLLAFASLIFSTDAKLVKCPGGNLPDSANINRPRLSDIYPDYDNFEGEVKYYEWKKLRQLEFQFLKPDIEQWISTLKEIKKPYLCQKHIKVWFKDKKPRFFYLQHGNSYRRDFFAVNGDTIDFTTIDEYDFVGCVISQIGAGLWRYFYKDGRLRACMTYITFPGFERKIDFFDRLYDIDNYLYFDEDRAAYFDSTEYKNKFNKPVWNIHIDKKQFDYSVHGGRIWYGEG